MKADARVADEGGGVRSVRPVWAIVVRSFAFVRKEIVEIVRQPRLLALLVIGPFLLLMLFGFGYSESSIRKRAVFVGSEDSVYADVLENYEEQLGDFIESKGLVETVGAGRAMLAAGETDVVVVFPDDPEESVMAGERAVIEILHDEIDPIQEGAVEVAARLAIQEVNATVLTTVATTAQREMAPAGDVAVALADLADRIADDPSAADAVIENVRRLEPALDGTTTVLGRLELGDTTELDQVATTRRLAAEVAERAADLGDSSDEAEVGELAAKTSELAHELDRTMVLDPEVLVRPFESDTDNVLGESITPNDYFTPSSLALLLQHLALTFAALSLVRDRRTGLFELMRVGPLSSIEIIVGKILAYLVVGIVVGAALIAGAVLALGVTFAGSLGWLAVTVIGVLLASLALGMMLATISRTESQAVQYAMLALLAGLFFSGFVLPVEGLSYPIRIISWLLPVTYGITSLQDVMLRGTAPSLGIVLGLGALVAVYGVVAILGLRRGLQQGATA